MTAEPTTVEQKANALKRLYAIGSQHFYAGDLKAARAAFEAIVLIDPGSRFAPRMLDRIWAAEQGSIYLLHPPAKRSKPAP